MVFPLVWAIGAGITGIVGFTTSYVANKVTEAEKIKLEEQKVESARQIAISKVPESQAVLATTSTWDDFFLFLRQNAVILVVATIVMIVIVKGVAK